MIYNVSILLKLQHLQEKETTFPHALTRSPLEFFNAIINLSSKLLEIVREWLGKNPRIDLESDFSNVASCRTQLEIKLIKGSSVSDWFSVLKICRNIKRQF